MASASERKVACFVASAGEQFATALGDLDVQWTRTLRKMGMLCPDADSVDAGKDVMDLVKNLVSDEVRKAAYNGAMALLTIRRKEQRDWREQEAEDVRTYFRRLADPVRLPSG